MPGRPAPRATLAAAAWLLTAVTAALPGLLLLVSAENRLPKGAAVALLAAAVVAVATGALCVRGVSAGLLGASGLVVLLCLASLVALEVDGRVSAAGGVLFGGVAAASAVVAGALTRRAAGT